MLRDWESMCQLAFRARWFGTEEERQKMDIGHRQSIRWGVFFEQLIFGSGMGGKTIELTDKERSSVYYTRVKKQAEEARNYLLKNNPITHMGSQVQLFGEIDVGGFKIPCEGNIDGQFGRNKIPELNVDTKLTADADNEYGDYAWGRPDLMDMGQLVMYRELTFLNYGVWVQSMYYVADTTPSERVEVIKPEFTEDYIMWYKDRLREAYIGITQAVNFNYWKPSSGYNECKVCPLRGTCPKAVKVPEVQVIIK